MGREDWAPWLRDWYIGWGIPLVAPDRARLDRRCEAFYRGWYAWFESVVTTRPDEPRIYEEYAL